MNYKEEYRNLPKIAKSKVVKGWEAETTLKKASLYAKITKANFNSEEWKLFKELINTELQAIKEMEFGTEVVK
jgi:hypothetical protein